MSAPVATRTLDEAIAWQLRFGAGDATAEDRSAFDRWLRAQPDNARAWRQLGELDGQLAPATPPAGRAAVLNAAKPPRRRGRRAVLLLAAVMVAGIAAAVADRHLPLSGLLADHATRTGERRSLILPDGTKVVLNTRSAIDVEFDERRRAVVLRDGEILVETAHGDPVEGRPFIVLTRNGSMHALGTRFLARRLEQGTLLTVLQSAVAARATNGGERVVHQQESALLRTGGIDGPYPAAADGDAWTDGMLVMDNARLADIVAELARYRPGRLVADSRVAELRVTGTLPLADPELALAALTRALPLRIERATDWWITLAPSRQP